MAVADLEGAHHGLDAVLALERVGAEADARERRAVVEGQGCVVALVVGTALGLATAYLVEPGLDLTALAAGGRDVALRLDPFAPLLLAAGLLAVSAAAVWATAAVVQRMSLSRSLRMGER